MQATELCLGPAVRYDREMKPKAASAAGLPTGTSGGAFLSWVESAAGAAATVLPPPSVVVPGAPMNSTEGFWVFVSLSLNLGHWRDWPELSLGHLLAAGWGKKGGILHREGGPLPPRGLIWGARLSEGEGVQIPFRQRRNCEQSKRHVSTAHIRLLL